MRVVSPAVGAIVERRYFDEAPIPALVVTPAGQVVQANRAMRRLAEALPEEANTVAQLFDVADAGAVIEFLLRFTARSTRRDGPLVTVAGRRVGVVGAATGLGDGSVGVCLQLVDRDDRDDAEAELQRLAYEDAQTGLLNRRGFDVAAEQLLDVARREDRSVAFMFIDVDGLKATNDTHGHAAGDRVIAAVGDLLRHACRGADAVGRYGGDEFCVLGLIDGQVTAEGLRGRLMGSGLAVDLDQEGPPLPVRLTVGLVHARARDVHDLPSLVDAGDAAMYAQRRQERSTLTSR